MTKSEYIGYLEALLDLAQDDTFDASAEYVLEKVLTKARTLDENTQYVPYYPTYPVWSPTTWYSTTTSGGTMTKSEYIGYLEALLDLAQDDTFDDGVEYVLEKALTKARTLDENTQYVPYYPTYPVYSTTTSVAKDVASNVLDLLPDPNDWSVTADGDGTWSVVRRN